MKVIVWTNVVIKDLKISRYQKYVYNCKVKTIIFGDVFSIYC